MIDKIHSQIYISESVIQNNEEWAIMLVDQTDKEKLILLDIKNNRLKDYIVGTVGGTWGKISTLKNTPKKWGCFSSNGKRDKCIIF